MTHTKLQLGELFVTKGAKAKLSIPEMIHAMTRHSKGDFGDISEEDWALNEQALEIGERILSAYTDMNGTRFWIITEADRYCTTILLPEEY